MKKTPIVFVKINIITFSLQCSVVFNDMVSSCCNVHAIQLPTEIHWKLGSATSRTNS